MFNFNEDPRPHVEIELGGVRIVGLLDSGADCSLLGKGCGDLISALGVQTSDSSSIVITADGTHHVVTKEVRLPVLYSNISRELRFILMPNLARKLILGIDFFNAFNIQIKSCNLVSEALSVNVNNALSMDQLDQLAIIIKQFPRSTDDKLGRTSVLTHKIETEDNPPIKQRHYPVSPYVQKDMDEEYDRMIRLGVIEKSMSPWSSPMVCVRKSNGKIRLCLDCRKLNLVTKKDSYPVPYITRILGNIRGTKYLSKIDLKDAFWQVGLEQTSKEKTAFTIPGRGLYQFCVMPFGLSNAVQTQCRLMDSVLGFDLEPNVFAYLDDIVIATETFNEHMYFLKETANRLSRAGLTINIAKSEFCIEQIKYLGYVLDKEGLRTDDSKVQCIRDFPIPTTVKEVKRFLGMAGWYRRFIADFSTISAPITNLTRKEVGKFVWTQEAEESFQAIKKAPVLSMPDFKKPFILHTDASDVGIGGVLVQGEGLGEKVIGFMSQKLSSAQRKYSTTERECLAVLLAIEHFRPYVEGTHFSVITDHSSLIWLQNLKEPAGRLGRWILKLQQYDCRIVHRKGKFNVVPDALSRAFVFEIDVVQENWSLDPWYTDLRSKIAKDPSNYPDFEIRDLQVYKHCAGKDSLRLKVYDWRLVVPNNLRPKILKENHDDPLASHLGFYKTVNRIQEKYYWPRMNKEILDYVKRCEPCRANKTPTYIVRHELGEAKPLTEPWRVIAIDYLGPLPRSKRGNNFLFVVLDCFTKFITLVPVRKGDSNSAIKVLDEQIFTKFGVPEIIISDNGTPFVSKSFEEFVEIHNVKQWKNAVYHPQHNPAERPNKVIAAAIRNYVGNDHRLWDVEVHRISAAINTAKHQSAKFSPYFLNFGKEMIQSGLTHRINDQRRTICDSEETPIDLRDRLDEVRLKVTDNLKKAYEAYSKPYNLRARKVTFKPGEVVWRKDFSLSDASKHYSAKLGPKYIKCRIKKKQGTSTYLLEDLDGKVIKNPYSVSDLIKN